MYQITSKLSNLKQQAFIFPHILRKSRSSLAGGSGSGSFMGFQSSCQLGLHSSEGWTGTGESASQGPSSCRCWLEASVLRPMDLLECSHNMAAGFPRMSDSKETRRKQHALQDRIEAACLCVFIFLFIWSTSSPVTLQGRASNSILWRECQEIVDIFVDTMIPMKGFWYFIKCVSDPGTEKLRVGRSELAVVSRPIWGKLEPGWCGREDRGNHRLQTHQELVSFYFTTQLCLMAEC